MSDPQIQFGQTAALADEIVAYLNAQDAMTTGTPPVNASPFCLRLTANRVYARILDLAKLPNPGDPVRVDLSPGDETEQRRGIAAVFLAEYSVRLMIQQKIGAAGTTAGEAQCSLLDQLRSQIIEALKGGPDRNAATAVHPFKATLLTITTPKEQEGTYVASRLEGDNSYYSETILTFKAAV